MNKERTQNASFVFEKMKKHYPNFETPDDITVGEWVSVLDGYSQTDILEALKTYRKNVPYDVAPSPKNFKEYLPHSHYSEEVPTSEIIKGDFAWEQMNSDIRVGCCRNNLYVYRDAEKIVLNEWLAEYLPHDAIRKMSYYQKLQQATEKGLLSNFDEALRQASQARFGKDYEFESANDLVNSKQRHDFDLEKMSESLAAHWGV